MRTLIALAFFTVGCAQHVATDEEAATFDEANGKLDGLIDELSFGTYTRPDASDGELMRLVLIEAPESELPAQHFEGRYEATERVNGEERTSEGFFNIYRCRQVRWIRLVTPEGRPGTVHAKYAWERNGDTLQLHGHRAERGFNMERASELPSTATCTLTRQIDVPPGFEASIATEFDLDTDVSVYPTEGLDAYEGNYSFEIGRVDDEIWVFLFENNRLFEEVWSEVCALPTAPDEEFCAFDIHLNDALWTDGTRNIVHFFSFGCRFPDRERQN